MIGEVLAAAASGRPTCVVIQGVPGVGKSDLVATARAEADARGFATVTCQAVEHTIDRPLAPLVTAPGLGDQVLKRHAAGAPAPGVATAAGWFLLADDLFGVVESLCSARPLLLVLEDAHFADPETLAWIRSTVDRAEGLPLAVIITGRPSRGTSPAQAMLEEVLAHRLTSVLVVSPLTRGESWTMAGALIGASLDPALRAAVDTAGGNPLLIRAVVTSATAPLAGRAALTDAGSVLALQVRDLMPAALRTMQVMAVLGERVDARALVAMVGGRIGDMLHDLESAETAGILAVDDHQLRFTHELYRQALLDMLAPSGRAILHLQAAKALAASGGAIVDIAEHYARGAIPDDPETLSWLRHAAAELVATSPASALRVVDIALDLCRSDVPPALRAEHVRTLAAVGRIAEADALGRSLLHEDMDPDIEALVRRELSFARLMLGDRDECISQIQACLAVSADATHRARTLGDLAFAHIFTGDHTGAEGAAQRALTEGARTGDTAAVIAGNGVLTLLDLYSHAMPAAQTRSVRLLDLAELREARDAGAFQPWFIACLVRLHSDDVRSVLPVARRGRDVAAESGAAWALPAYDAATAFASLRTGALDDAATVAEAALTYQAGIDGLGIAVWCLGFLAQVGLHRGDTAMAHTHVRTALSILGKDRRQLGFEQVQIAHARLLELDHRPDHALAELATVWDFMSQVGQIAGRNAVGAPLVRLACHTGDHRRAEDTVAAMRSSTERAGTIAASAELELATAWLDKDPDAARRASNLASRVNHPVLAAQAIESAAELLRQSGRRGDAAGAAGSAARRWLAMGAVGDAERCTALYGGKSSSTARPVAGIGALTRTERTITGLVGQGLTNTDIAEVLGISRRTVRDACLVRLPQARSVDPSRDRAYRTSPSHQLTAAFDASTLGADLTCLPVNAPLALGQGARVSCGAKCPPQAV